MPLPMQSTDEGLTNGNKLHIACQDLHEQLTKISTTSFAPLPEIQILRAAPPSHIHHSTTTQSSNNNGEDHEFQEGEAYRCKCIFQIVPRSSINATRDDGHNDNTEQTTTTTDDNDHSNYLIYVTREDGKICPLPNGIFAPANIRIRRAMIDLLECLNKKSCNNIINNSTNETKSSIYTFGLLRKNITSVTFVTSWGDGIIERSLSESSTSENSLGGGDGGDCLVTLHYGPPGLPTNKDEKCIDTLKAWKDEAKLLCGQCNFSLLTGRSKGVKISVSGTSTHGSNCDNLDASIREEGIIHDDLWLTIRDDRGHGTSKMVEIERVSLVPPTLLQFVEDEANQKIVHHQTHVRIQYQKPATAFQHPNAGVMLTSLHWILNILSKIEKHTATNQATEAATTTIAKSTTTKPRLLEMYCGCGAHTIPLAKSTLLSEIVAVELDDRLVNACRNNCHLNNCLKDGCDDGDNSEHSNVAHDRTLVQVFKGDAAEWAAKTLRRQRKHDDKKIGESSSSKCTDDNNNFDILLVDPPRDGLNNTVCDMCLKGTFDHVIYVSCGRRALLRDFAILCGMGGFNVVDLAVIDLFPGTDAVESLVHLKRR